MIWEPRPVLWKFAEDVWILIQLLLLFFPFVSSSSLGDLFYILLPYLSLRVLPSLPARDDCQGRVTLQYR